MTNFWHTCKNGDIRHVKHLTLFFYFCTFKIRRLLCSQPIKLQINRKNISLQQMRLQKQVLLIYNKITPVALFILFKKNLIHCRTHIRVNYEKEKERSKKRVVNSLAFAFVLLTYGVTLSAVKCHLFSEQIVV
jgi:hypothetical protein